VRTQAQTDSAHCADKIEIGVSADRPVHDTGVHTTHGTGSGGLGQATSRMGLPT